MPKTYLFLSDIIAIANNGKLLLKRRAPQFFPSSAAILFVVLSANGDYSASSRVNLLNDDAYRLDSATIITVCDPSDYSTRKAFLECAIVELVYKFNEKSTASG